MPEQDQHGQKSSELGGDDIELIGNRAGNQAAEKLYRGQQKSARAFSGGRNTTGGGREPLQGVTAGECVAGETKPGQSESESILVGREDATSKEWNQIARYRQEADCENEGSEDSSSQELQKHGADTCHVWALSVFESTRKTGRRFNSS